jgi:hypothetical protein
MIERERDILRVTDLTRGVVRAQRPVYMDFLPSCNLACPAGEHHGRRRSAK